MSRPLTLLTYGADDLQLPGHVLSKPVTETRFANIDSADLQELVTALFYTMYNTPRCAGMAANMAGYGLRVIVVDPGGDPRLFLNPRVESQSEEREERQEENLSVPGVLFPASRSKSIRLSYESLDGSRRVAKCRGFLARLVLHELDILDGKLDTLLNQRQGDILIPPADIGSLTPVTTVPALLGIRESVLRMNAQSVDFDLLSRETLSDLAERMFALQYKLNGVGLAAPQIGVSLRMAVIDDTAGNVLVICNPEILDYSEERAKEDYKEACLSLPGYRGTPDRAETVTVRYQTVSGETVTTRADGFLARILQHEIDHLDGKLYVDRVAKGVDGLAPVDPLSRAEAAMEAALADRG